MSVYLKNPISVFLRVECISEFIYVQNISLVLQYKYLIVEWIIGVFDHGSAGKESACTVGELGLTLGLGRSPGEAKGYPLQYSG